MKNLVTSPWRPGASTGERKLILTANRKVSTIEERNPVRLFWANNNGPANDPALRILVIAPGGDFWFDQEEPKMLNVTSRYSLFTDPDIFRFLSSADRREIKAGLWNPHHLYEWNYSFWVFGKEIRKGIHKVTSQDDMILIATVQGTAVSGTEMQVYVDGEYRGIWPRTRI